MNTDGHRSAAAAVLTREAGRDGIRFTCMRTPRTLPRAMICRACTRTRTRTRKAVDDRPNTCTTGRVRVRARGRVRASELHCRLSPGCVLWFKDAGVAQLRHRGGILGAWTAPGVPSHAAHRI